MKRILSLLIALTMCIGMIPVAFAAEMKFTDVSTSDWFYNDVKTAVESGLVNGKSATTYAPNDNLTYAEAIKLAACMNQLYNEGAITLTSGSPWYKPYVDYCVENGIIDKEYNYEDFATRAGYMGIFANALPDEGLKAINNVPDDSIPDVPSSRSYAPGIYKLYRAGILQGVDDAHNCNPLANITRAEVAAILTRMMDESKRVIIDDMGTVEQKPEEKETEVTEPEVKEPETTGTSSGGAKDKFQQVDSVELKKEDFTMTIDDCFVVTGRGIVITGYVAGGKLEKGDTIYINDADGKFVAETKAVNIEMFRKLIDECEKGDTAGIQLDLDVETWRTKIVKGYVASATKGTSSRPTVNTRPSTTTRPFTSTALAYKTQPVSTTVNADEYATFTVEVTGGKAPYQYYWMAAPAVGRGQEYQWEYLGEDKAGAEFIWSTSSNTLKVRPNKVGIVYYHSVVIDANGDSIVSNNVYLTANAGNIHIEVSGTMSTYNDNDILALTANVYGGSGKYSYQWQNTNTPDAQDKWHNANYTTKTYKDNEPICYLDLDRVIGGKADNYYARVCVTDLETNKTAYSSYVRGIAVWGMDEFVISETKAIVLIKDSDKLAFEKGKEKAVELEVFGGKAPYTYRWEYSTDGTSFKSIPLEAAWADSVAKYNLKVTYDGVGIIKGNYLRCKVTDANGTVFYSDPLKVIEHIDLT